ncbi:MAG: hypothetical protein HUU06_00615 [Planctomycetaceae bacterium]|nr:hypothetical protein [Planctomycetota bacterium]NUN51274.1 hypothetical protein [Planctomycetaceae bacterium]
MSIRMGLTALAVIAAFGVALSPAGDDAALAGDGCCGGGAEGGGHAGHGGGGAAATPEEGATKAQDAGQAKEAKGLLVDLGNGKCPIMGGKPDGKTFTEWNGLRVGHCCGMCSAKFLADPSGALEKAGIDWKPAAAAVKAVADAKTPEDRVKALKSLAAKWKVLRGADPVPSPARPGLLVDLGNEKCPIMGGKPDGRTFSEWKGLRVGHCCGMCSAKFLADPSRALEKAGIDWKPAAAAVKTVADAKTPEDRAKALKALASRWKVVREPAPEPAPGSRDAPAK